jgi:hypothetical protein
MPTAQLPGWTITIDGQALGDGALPRALRCEIGMDGVGALHLDLIVPRDATLPAIGAPISVELSLDDASATVFTGEIDGVRVTADGAAISAGDGLARLANSFITGVYEDQSAGAIARDLVSQAGLTAGTIDDGPTLKSYALFPGVSALAHLGRLAALIGGDLFTDGGGKVHLAAPVASSPAHTLQYGAGVLELGLVKLPSTRSGLDVWGEGAASSAGSDKAHWLPDGLDGVKGQADIDGDPVYAAPADLRREFVRDGALRTGDAAAAVAKARAAAVRPVRGAILAIGVPAVTPGDGVTLDGLPDGHPLAQLLDTQPLRVRRVRHCFDIARGFTTRMEF